MWANNQNDDMGFDSVINQRKSGLSSVKMAKGEIWTEDHFNTGRATYTYPSSFYDLASPNNHNRFQSEQKICCDNGKSYFDLGSWNIKSTKYCEGKKTNWCSHGRACYKQKRLTVLNISMCKLSRYRRFSDPSLYRSVLICNTLRLIEREMEQEGYFNNSMSNNIVLNTTATESVPDRPLPLLTPFPSNATENDSGIGDERTIDWSSVLCLSNQSHLDSVNNNESEDNSEMVGTSSNSSLYQTFHIIQPVDSASTLNNTC